METIRGMVVLSVVLAVVGAGCKVQDKVEQAIQASSGGDAGPTTPAFSLSVYNANNLNQATGPAIYDSNNSGSGLRLNAGSNYVFALASDNREARFQMTFTNVDLVNPVASPAVTLKIGNNLVAAPSPGGDFAIAINATLGVASASKTYQASVSCNYPEGTAPLSTESLNANAISVSAGGGMNLYNFSVAGITAGAGGIGPYVCALDFTGVGIRDSAFQPCDQAFNNIYVNYVANRNVGVIVKDSCNTAVTAARVVNLPLGGLATLTGGNGIVFLHGQTANATGALAANPAVHNVNYWATNVNENLVVQPVFHNAGVNSTFQIKASYTYGMASSVKFGMSLSLAGIRSTYDPATGNGTIDMSAAQITRVTYTTDQAGDSRPQVKLTATNCTLSNQSARVVFVQGTPCTNSDGTPGANARYTVEIWGSYNCPAVPSGSDRVDISGTFDGVEDIVDSCWGGGGGGGGGIVPINF